MAVGKEIRLKITSIKNTQKITRALEMVAASKMRKTQDRMLATRPYSRKVAQIIRHLATANPEYRHPYTVARPVSRVGVILVSSDRGLCGGLNANLFRLALRRLREWSETGVDAQLGVIGQKGAGFFNAIGANIAAQATRQSPGAQVHPEAVTDTCSPNRQSAHSLRVYSVTEQDHLGAQCLGFITFLESAGVLPAAMREIVIDRAMAAPGDPVSIDELKIIVLMVYWSFGQEPDALVLDELCDDTEGRLAH